MTGCKKLLHQLDQTLQSIPLPPAADSTPLKDPKAPTAVLMVSGFNGLGIHSLLAIARGAGYQYKNLIFVSVGVVDNSKFKGVSELKNLEDNTISQLKKYVDYATRWGYYSEYKYSIGVDTIDELEQICREVLKEYPKSMFFAGKLIFKEENLINRVLHNQSALTIQSRLLYNGIPMVILPIRVFR